MPSLNELASKKVHLLNERVMPDYISKASDTGFAVMGIARMLAERSELTVEEKQCLLSALERLGDSLTDLSESVENQRHEINEDIKQHLNPLQQGGPRHA
ncbi:hypothetical protein [Oceanospirillum linum]|uniref:Uncharacterized protein n=1 Tax=Oceanospirillum linum TaxID=966 RepID=A0A1T1H8J5_OCELI|nr:hypothetical protein [Oceanospirillum linum]OOV86199.1 hypothetical protein BTA35_0214565 [Oceanospirillum linum]SEG38378.1 hypothetical protein SAMN04489856_10969 [Oleiphilus messinensis]SMP32121.1 hypothetical protein SAMN06264348_10960 [Oceanospirillum linum]